MGTELIGVTVGEAENPRKNIPRAIRRTFWRILIFYVSLLISCIRRDILTPCTWK